MTELSLSDIKTAQDFQLFCEQLLSAEYVDFQPVNDKTGDNGCDGKADNGGRFFQFYYPDGTGSYPHRMQKIRDKIARDLKKLAPPFPKNWILVTPEKASPDILKYAGDREKEFAGMKIIIWSEPKISELLAKHQHVLRSWVKRVYGSKYEVMPPESVSYSNRDNLPALLQLDHKLGESLRNWKLADYFDQVHTYSSDGKTSITLRPKSGGLPFKGRMKFRFDKSEEAQKKMRELDDFRRRGTDFKADERFIDSFEISVDGVDLLPSRERIEKQELEIRSSKGKPIPVYLDMFRNRVRLRRIRDIELCVERSGSEETFLTNNHQSSHKLKVGLLFNRVTNTGDFKFRFYFENADALDGYDYSLVLSDFAKSTKIVLTFQNVKGQFSFMKAPTKGQFGDSVELSRKLLEIQDRTGQTLGSVFDPSLNEGDFRNILFVHNVVTTGREKMHISHLKVDVLSDVRPDLISLLISGEEMSNKVTLTNIAASLFGKDINLGETTAYLNSRLDAESRKRLKKAFGSGHVEGTPVTFVASGKEPADLFFHRWHRNVDRGMAKFEKGKKS